MISYKWTGWKWLAVSWFILITILFFVPTSNLPKENWLDKLHFDKLVHFGLFAVLLFLWRFLFPLEKNYSRWLFLLSVIYGLLIEIIQGEYTARSFDVWDIVADAAGSVAGLVVWWMIYKKNRPL